MAALLWLYTFLVTIVLVNLLIAQMSSTYEAVKDNAEQLALYQKVELFLEYKDNREVLPPPLNLVVILCYRLPKLTVQFFARFCCRVGTFEMMQVPPPHPSPEVLLRPSLWVLMPLPFVMMQESWLLFRKPPPPGFLSPRAAVKAVELLRREHRRARAESESSSSPNAHPAPTHGHGAPPRSNGDPRALERPYPCSPRAAPAIQPWPCRPPSRHMGLASCAACSLSYPRTTTTTGCASATSRRTASGAASRSRRCSPTCR